MTNDGTKRSTEHPIDRPPDTDPQQGHEHPEADPPAPHSRQGNHGANSDNAPGLVAPSALNQRDTGAASDAPEGGGTLQFDDGDMIDGGRGGNKARTGGTWQAQGADSGELGPPAEVFSNSNQPSTGPVSSGPGRRRQA